MPRPEEHLSTVRDHLRSRFLERDELVDGALAALLTGQHLLMLGPPGTAKSMVAREVCRCLGDAPYFEWLLTKFSTPEELFGPMSLPALEQGRYERVVAGKLPEAEIAFLDEVFKASSAILNALLTVLNERSFHQGSTAMQVPLQTLFGASNELPDDEGLGALYDRFLFRYAVGYLEHDYQFARLLKLKPEAPAPALLLDPETLTALKTRVAQTEVPDGVLTDLIDIRKELQSEGVVASDRRYRQSVAVLQAAAVLDDRGEVEVSDLAWLEHVLWTEPEDRPKVAAALGQVVSGFEAEAKRLLYQAREIEAYAQRDWPDQVSRDRAMVESQAKLRDIEARLFGLRQQQEKKGRSAQRLLELTNEVAVLKLTLFVGQTQN